MSDNIAVGQGPSTIVSNFMRNVFLAVLLVIQVLVMGPIYAAGNACAGNLVWVDDNEDGIKNPQESGYIGGINVNLQNQLGLVVDTQYSENGYFEVCAKNSGQYRVEIEIPDGYQVSPRFIGESEYHDSDADEHGVIDVELIRGRSIGKYDIGLVPNDGNAILAASADTSVPELPVSQNVVHSSQESSVLFGPWVQDKHRNDGAFDEFNAAQLWASTSSIIEVLRDARSTQTSLFLQLGPASEWGWNDNRSAFTIAKWRRSVDRFANDPTINNAISKAIDDGVIRSIYLIDEPHHKRWSPNQKYNYITNVDIDDMARYVKQYWPNASTSVRASPRTLVHYGRGRHSWKHLDEAFLMINYRKWAANGEGTIEAFMEREISEANIQGLGLVGSIQMLIGAPTSNQTFWPDFRNGGARPTGKLKVSPIELRTYVDAFLERRDRYGRIDPNGDRLFDSIMIFRWDRNSETDWQNVFYRDVVNELVAYIRTL